MAAHYIQNDKWLEETGGDRKKLKEYFNCEYKSMQIQNGNGGDIFEE